MKLLSLFSGAGIGDLGWMMAGMDIVGQVEIDDYCQKILEIRYPESKKWKDIRSVTGQEIIKECGTIDVVAGGFPCQPFSVAGKQKGQEDDRNLWPEMCRLISEIKPRWVIGENVLNIINNYADKVLNDLEAEGYQTVTIVFPAFSIGADQRRERVWFVASNNDLRMEIRRRFNDPVKNGHNRSGVCKSQLLRSSQQAYKVSSFVSKYEANRKNEFRVFRRTDDDPHRMDRVKSLGNGQVVACTAWIGERIMDFERMNLLKH